HSVYTLIMKLSLYYTSYSLTFFILQLSSSLSSLLNIIIIYDFYFFFYSTLSICLSIILYMFLTITLYFHNKYYHSTHIRQFVSKFSCVDRFISINNSELNVELLIKNLKNMIIKKLSMLYITESLTFSSISSVTVSFSATSLQSSISTSVSDSLTSAISVFMISTSATSASITVFITSSLCFKKILHRLSELCFSRITLSLNSIKIINICVFRNRNMNIILFYIYKCET
ncbi:hypothetical protein BDDG_13057, partial [Blastomyces dermatitidis ATCC 18188]